MMHRVLGVLALLPCNGCIFPVAMTLVKNALRVTPTHLVFSSTQRPICGHSCQHCSNRCTLGEFDLDNGVIGCVKYGGEFSREASEDQPSDEGGDYRARVSPRTNWSGSRYSEGVTNVALCGT